MLDRGGMRVKMSKRGSSPGRRAKGGILTQSYSDKCCNRRAIESTIKPQLRSLRGLANVRAASRLRGGGGEAMGGFRRKGGRRTTMVRNGRKIRELSAGGRALPDRAFSSASTTGCHALPESRHGGAERHCFERLVSLERS